MIAMLKSFLAFLLPILRSASIQVAADAINDLAYPKRSKRYTPYNRMRSYAEYDADLTRKLTDEAQAMAKKADRLDNSRSQYDPFFDGFQTRLDTPAESYIKPERLRLGNPADYYPLSGGFHDVLMVAFDVTGVAPGLVHEWLHEQMPAGDTTYIDAAGNDVHLDSWWVANDERFDGSDCDSAVFVSKGKQKVARAILRDEGMLL